MTEITEPQAAATQGVSDSTQLLGTVPEVNLVARLRLLADWHKPGGDRPAGDPVNEWEQYGTLRGAAVEIERLHDVADAVCKYFSAAGISPVIGSPNPLEDLLARAVISLGGEVKREHVASAACWCEPEIDYTDPETGVSVLVHKLIQ